MRPWFSVLDHVGGERAARRVAPLLGLLDFLVLYALLLALAVSAALVLYATRPRLSLRLHSSR